jgi:hypothetical protein
LSFQGVQKLFQCSGRVLQSLLLEPHRLVHGSRSQFQEIS